MNLQGKIVVVTGSSVGIGRATAIEFAKEGANLVITYRTNKKEAEGTVFKCKDSGSKNVLLLQLDITDNDSIKNAVKKIKEHFGKIDILVNNAGVLVWEPFGNHSLGDIEYLCRTNLEGTIKMTREAIPLVSSIIINISSQVGTIPYADSLVYSATKWGIRGFSKGLADDEPDLKVYSVNPGATATKMTDFEGVAPEEVGKLIVGLCKGDIKIDSGGDLNVWEYPMKPKLKAI